MLSMNTKEIALISVMSAVWASTQIYLGPTIGQITHVHGVVMNFLGWLLMPILAELTGKFGRVTVMASVAALATRFARRTAALYIWVVGFGYAIGGLTFDLLFFIQSADKLNGKSRKGYLLTTSLISGFVANVPYVLFQLILLLPPAFFVWLPTYVPLLAKDLILNISRTTAGLSILTLIKPWSIKVRK